MTKRCALIVLTSLAPLVLASCVFITNWNYRYRLTVEIEHRGKLYKNSGVIAVRREQGIGAIGAQVKGDAVPVDLGKAGIVFALMHGNKIGEGWPDSVAHRAFASELGTVGMRNTDALDKLEELTGAQSVLAVEDYPMLVRFRDIKDPRSVELVTPEDISAGFGSGIKIRRITMRITDDPVTKGIESTLPWLNQIRGNLGQDNKRHPGQPEKDVNRWAFSRDEMLLSQLRNLTAALLGNDGG